MINPTKRMFRLEKVNDKRPVRRLKGMINNGVNVRIIWMLSSLALGNACWMRPKAGETAAPDNMERKDRDRMVGFRKLDLFIQIEAHFV